MTPILIALVVAAIAVVIVHARESARSDRSKRELTRSSLDPDTLETLAAEDPAERERARRRLLLRGAPGIAPLFARLEQLEDDGMPPHHQLAIEDTIADLGLAGASAMLVSLGQLPRRHAAIPAVARVVDAVGAKSIDASNWRALSVENELLLLRRLAAAHGLDALDRLQTPAATLLRAVVAPDCDPAARHLAAHLPGATHATRRRDWVVRAPALGPSLAFEIAEACPERVATAADPRTVDLVVAVAPALRGAETARALGWGASVEPADGDERRWLRWAAAHAATDPRVFEAMHLIASGASAQAWMAVALVSLVNREATLELLRGGRRRPWSVDDAEWARIAARAAAATNEAGALVALLDAATAAAPSTAATLGAALADFEPSVHMPTLLARYAAAEGWWAAWLETAIDAAGPAARDAGVACVRSDDSRTRRGATELAGRLGWTEAAQAIAAGCARGDADEGVGVVALELLGESSLDAAIPFASVSPSMAYLAELGAHLRERRGAPP